jgi:putative DNA primase/helicase
VAHLGLNLIDLEGIRPFSSQPGQIDTADAFRTFEQELFEHGLRPDKVIADGKIHRCPVEGKPRDKDGAYCLHLGGAAPWGLYQNWCTDDEYQLWYGRDLATLDAAVLARLEAEKEAAKKAYEVERAEGAAAAARNAAARWNAATPVFDIKGTYLEKKGIRANGARLEGATTLLVPMYSNETETLVNIQSIAPDSSKRFMSGGQVADCHYVLGSAATPPRVYVAEGFATAASIYEATGNPVVVAFGARNLTGAALWAKKHFPSADLII